MIRQFIVPSENKVTLEIPSNLVGKKVEVILFADEEVAKTLGNSETPTTERRKRTFEEARAFYEKNGVGFSKLGKWTREDLYE
jgi:hypothetical protein